MRALRVSGILPTPGASSAAPAEATDAIFAPCLGNSFSLSSQRRLIRMIPNTDNWPTYQPAAPTGALTLHAAGPQDIGEEVSHGDAQCTILSSTSLGTADC